MDSFKPFKENLKDKVPINLFLHSSHYNIYLKETFSKVKTQSQLVDFLVDLSKELLSKINTTELLEKKFISSVNNFQITVLSENHRVNQLALTEKFSDGEIEYIKVIKKWLVNEKEYFLELSKLLPYSKCEPPQKIIANNSEKDLINESSNTNLNILNKLKLQLSKGEIEEVLETFLETNFKKDFKNSIIILKQRDTDYKQKSVVGTLSQSDFVVEKSRITESLLHFIDEMKNE